MRQRTFIGKRTSGRGRIQQGRGHFAVYIGIFAAGRRSVDATVNQYKHFRFWAGDQKLSKRQLDFTSS